MLSFRPYKFLGTYRSCTAVPTSLTRFSKGISSFCPQAGASTAGDWRGDELERGFKAKNPFRNGFAIIHFRLSFHRDKPWQNKDCFIDKVLGKPLRSLFSLLGIERSRYCFTLIYVQHGLFLLCFPWGRVAGAGGLGTLELTEPFLFQAGTAQRDMSREKTTRDGIGGESEFPHLGPLPLTLVLLTFFPTL